MCRRCGEPDRRGNAEQRRRRRDRLLDQYGNGVVCPCIYCGVLLAHERGYLAVAGRRLRIDRLEQDRLMPGGPYALWNLVPACGPCNRARTYAEQHIPDGCEYGSGIRKELTA